MIEELAKSLKATLYDRLSSPFLGSVIVFWLGFNWKLLYVFFSGDNTVFERISIIDKNYIDAWRNIWYPLIYGGLVGILYPFFSVIPYGLYKLTNSAKIKIRNRIENITTISIEEFNNLKKEIYEKDRELIKLFEQKSQNERELSAQIEDLLRIKNETDITLAEEEEKSKELLKYPKVEHAKVKSQILKTVSKLNDHISNSYSGALCEFVKSYSDKIPGIKNDYGHFNLLKSWLDCLKRRAENDVLANGLEEVNSLIRNITGLAESIRSDIKYHIRSDDFSRMDSTSKRYVYDAKEQWDAIKSDINNTIMTWKEFLESDFLSSEKIGSTYFEILKPIEEEASDEKNNPRVEEENVVFPP